MKLPQIVGIAGTNGSGKDTLGALLHKKLGYDVQSLSDVLRGELDKLGKEHTRENLSGMSRQIREAEGDGAMSERAIVSWREADHGSGLCITSLRTPGEAKAIRAEGGVIVWVDADDRRRYERVVSGARGRVTDTISFDEFMEQQRREMTPSEKGGGLNMGAVRDIADVFVENNYDTIDEYETFLRQYFELSER